MLGAYSNLPLIEIWVSWRGLQFNNNKDRTQMRDLECHSVSARILHTRANNLFCFDISMRKTFISGSFQWHVWQPEKAATAIKSQHLITSDYISKHKNSKRIRQQNTLTSFQIRYFQNEVTPFTMPIIT